MRPKTAILILIGVALIALLAWRMLRPMNIFLVSDAFERPIPVTVLPNAVTSQSAEACGRCHAEIYNEWHTAMHSRAWTDPYFQADWRFDGSRQICRNCHTPLADQQENLILGFRDQDKWDPILKPNPHFDTTLQHEGVTCNVCHLREGKILGPYARTNAPHAVTKMDNSNQVCVRCHVVQGGRWDTFFRFPPCGTVAEIEAGRGRWPTRSGEVTVKNPASLGCVECHMPAIIRPLVPGGPPRTTRRHLWRGGHDPEMIRKGLDVQFTRQAGPAGKEVTFALRLENVGAGHYLPTGTPDRYLSVELRLLGKDGKVLKEEQGVLKRTVMWRPFIVDLWDTRLAPHEPRTFTLAYSAGNYPGAEAIEAVVHYHLVGEARRRRINYPTTEPIEFEIYHKRLPLGVAEDAS